MKTFIIDSDPLLLNIRNFERIDEEILLKKIISIFSKERCTEIGKRVECPSEDLYFCKFKGNEFTIIYSLDDGVSLRFHDKETLEQIQKIIESN